ncbi:MAG TPA: nicotinamide riboside transporter PnuC [Chitinophagaceae bacterium]|nr:nicotinamide riboside transporter PnuC [Chitinophagaceae bacterium]
MNFQDLYQGFLMGIENMSIVEAIAVIFAVISVFCAKANSVWVYPTGIVGIVFSIYIFIDTEYKLYPDAALNLYYLIMSIYGWYFWTHTRGKATETPITYCNKKEYLWAALIFIGLWGGLYWWLTTYNINDVPKMDSFTSALAATGMWLLARRKIENWLALAVADFVDIGVYFYKRLLLFSFLNVFYVVIAILGYIAWKKWIEKQQKYQISLS